MSAARKGRAEARGGGAAGEAPAAGATPATLPEQSLLAEGEAMFRFALARCRDAELARDAAQEACLRLIESESEGRRVRNRQAWMRKVIENYLCDDARRAARCAPLQEARAAPEAPPPEPAQRPPATLPLTSREAECVRLRLDGRSYSEIAEILHLHPGSVARLLSRAMTKLRQRR